MFYFGMFSVVLAGEDVTQEMASATVGLLSYVPEAITKQLGLQSFSEVLKPFGLHLHHQQEM